MERIDTVRTETEALLKKIVSEYSLDVAEENGAFQIVIKTEEAPSLIGRHGETVRAFQKLLEVMIIEKNKQSD